MRPPGHSSVIRLFGPHLLHFPTILSRQKFIRHTQSGTEVGIITSICCAVADRFNNTTLNGHCTRVLSHSASKRIGNYVMDRLRFPANAFLSNRSHLAKRQPNKRCTHWNSQPPLSFLVEPPRQLTAAEIHQIEKICMPTYRRAQDLISVQHGDVIL